MCKILCLLTSFAIVLHLAPAAAVEHADQNVILWWTLDEGKGHVAVDSSGLGNDGTIYGKPKWVAGQCGTALEFDGQNDHILIDNVRGLAAGPLTVLAWINGILPGRVIASQKDGANWLLASQPAGYLMTNLVRVGPWRQPLSSDNVITGLGWQHVGLTWDDGKVILYVNAEQVASGAAGELPVPDGKLILGGGSGLQQGSFWSGMIDDVRVYDRALSQEEIVAIQDGLCGSLLKASEPQPADGATGVTTVLLKWTAGETALSHNIYFGINPELTEADLVARNQSSEFYYPLLPLVPGITYYWRVDEVEADMTTVHTGDVWRFLAEPLKAYRPRPVDGSAGELPGLILTWSEGKRAIASDVYLASDKGTVAAGALSAAKGTVTDARFNTGVLRPATTYFWRIDTVSTGGVERGNVWSFSTIDAAPASKVWYQNWMDIGGTAVGNLIADPRYPSNPDTVEYIDTFESRIDWADNYGNRLFGWVKPLGTGDYTFWIAGDDQQQLWLSTDANPANAVMIADVPGWTPARDFDNTGGGVGGPSQESLPQSLTKGQKYFIMALGKEGTGGDSTSVAWQGPGIATREIIKGQYVDAFGLPPLTATDPWPENGAVDVTQIPTLRWTAGENAKQHEVYFGQNKAAVAMADHSSPLWMGTQPGTTFDPGTLDSGRTYYWRVDQVNDANPDSPWKGTVWSFTTPADVFVIDDFEGYLNSGAVFVGNTWLPRGGAFLPYVDRMTVYSGKQSMALDYNLAFEYSEVARTFDMPLNLARYDESVVSLWFRGNPANGPGRLYVAAGGAKVPHPNREAVSFADWTEWRIDLNSFAGVDPRNVTEIALGVDRVDAGDRTVPFGSVSVSATSYPDSTGTVYWDLIEVKGARLIDSVTLTGYVRCVFTGDVVAEPSVYFGGLGSPAAYVDRNWKYRVSLMKEFLDDYEVIVEAGGYERDYPDVWISCERPHRDFVLMPKGTSLVCPVYRFQESQGSCYYYTVGEYPPVQASRSEKNTLLSDPNWRYDGIAFCGIDIADSNHTNDVSVCRFSSVNNVPPAYAIEVTDPPKTCEGQAPDLDSTRWWCEGEVFHAYPPCAPDGTPYPTERGGGPAGTSPVYRFRSVSGGCYYYTMDKNEPDADDWSYEGIAWYAFDCPGVCP